MADPIEYDPPRDPLYRDMRLRHTAEIPVLGVPVRFASNSPDVIAIAERAFGVWRRLEGSGLIESEGVTVTIVVHPGDEGDVEHAEIYYRVLDGHRVLLGSRGSIGYTDPGRRDATAFVTPALVADRQHFRYMVVESLTLSAVTPHDRQPFHAAAVVRGGAAVILAGPSEVGKSTLTYAAARSGFQVLADDTVHLQSHPILRIWGLPGYVHLPPDSRERFPELRDAAPALRANGKEKLAIDLRAIDALPDLPVVERAVLCLLSRRPGAPGLRRLDPDEVVDELMGNLEEGFDMFHKTLRGPLAQLAAAGVWELSVPDDPAKALPWLHRLVDEVPPSL